MKAEHDAVEPRLQGGIVQAFECVLSMKKQALIGGIKCMYWLTKGEIAHTTNFKSLLELAVSHSSTYLTELHQGGNAKYTSHQSMNKLITVLSQCIERDIHKEIEQADYVNVISLCDETTESDVSITKQLIFYICYMCGEELKM